MGLGYSPRGGAGKPKLHGFSIVGIWREHR
jgi:hypothetical protein